LLTSLLSLLTSCFLLLAFGLRFFFGALSLGFLLTCSRGLLLAPRCLFTLGLTGRSFLFLTTLHCLFTRGSRGLTILFRALGFALGLGLFPALYFFRLALRLFSARTLAWSCLLPAALLLAACLAFCRRLRALRLTFLLRAARRSLLFTPWWLALLFGARARLFSTLRLAFLRAARGRLLPFTSRWALVGGLAFALLGLPLALRFAWGCLLLTRLPFLPALLGIAAGRLLVVAARRGSRLAVRRGRVLAT
jgi:hypothetical protein